MKETLTNLVQLLNRLEVDLNNHTNPNCKLVLLTHEGEPSVTYTVNAKIIRMAIKLSRQNYVKHRKKDTYYAPGMHPMEIREREMKEKGHAPEPDYTPKSVKTVTYLDEPERKVMVQKAAELKEEVKQHVGVD